MASKLSKQRYVCLECGWQSIKWVGQCQKCHNYGTLELQEVYEQTASALGALDTGNHQVTTLDKVADIGVDKIQTGIDEVDQALSGGIGKGQVILLAGAPGIGKSTLALQIAAHFAQGHKMKTLYVSAEESINQLASRARRVVAKDMPKDLLGLATNNLKTVLGQIQQAKPELVIVDSIQTLWHSDVTGVPGNVSQVRICAAEIVNAAKQQGFSVIIIGHVNKDGDLAGPKVLEHLVDTVMMFEGEENYDYRIVRVIKNRYGSVGEVGILIMQEDGLRDYKSTNQLFISNTNADPGVARAVTIEGNRPIIVEVQALVSPTVFSYPKRVAEGVSISKLQTISALISAKTKLKLQDADIYVKTTGAYKLNDAGADLAIAAAIISAVKKTVVPDGAIFIGELALSGKILSPAKLEQRVREAKKFDYSSIIYNNTSGGTKGKSAVRTGFASIGNLADYISI